RAAGRPRAPGDRLDRPRGGARRLPARSGGGRGDRPSGALRAAGAAAAVTAFRRRGRRYRQHHAGQRARPDRLGRHGRRLRSRPGTGPAHHGAAVHPARRDAGRGQLRRVPAAAAGAGLGRPGRGARRGPAGLDDHRHRPVRGDRPCRADSRRAGAGPHRRGGGPVTMRAMAITEDHRLELTEMPEPVPAPGEVLVDVVAAGVNRADLAQVAGAYPPPPGASELPGLEVSGHRRDTGEAVVALLAGGGYAEVVAVPEPQLLPAPEGRDLVEAAGVIEVCATVVSNLVLEAHLAEGETVLIH